MDHCRDCAHWTPKWTNLGEKAAKEIGSFGRCNQSRLLRVLSARLCDTHELFGCGFWEPKC